MVLLAGHTLVEGHSTVQTEAFLTLRATKIRQARFEEEGVLALYRGTPGDICLLVNRVVKGQMVVLLHLGFCC
jgi:hypothetical protein